MKYLFLTLVFFFLLCSPLQCFLVDLEDDDSLQEARFLMAANPLIDGHNDLPYQYRDQWEDRVFENTTDLLTFVPTLQTDIPRLRSGEVGGQFWSIYVDCSHQHRDAVRATLEQVDVVYKMIKRYSNTFQFALTASDIQTAFAQKKIASLMGIEGGHSIDSSLGALRMFYQLGVRYMTLTHNCNTPWADSCCAGSFPNNGLSYFGEQLVQEMNRLGMLVDLSHVSEQTMQDALDATRAPVIFSHSNAYTLCDNPRNVPDSILSQMEANGGIVMVNFYPPFVSCKNESTISQVADHIDYIRSKCGDSCVGIGADFDGVSETTIGLENVSRYPYLIAELIRRQYTPEQITKVIGGNLIRVMQEVEDVAHALQSEVPQERTIYPNSSYLEKVCRTTD